MNQRYRSMLILPLIGPLLGVGCSQSSATGSRGTPEIETVRSGILANYKSTTVGKAFEGTFQNGKWSSFETGKGQVVVEFNGTIKHGALSQAGLVGRRDYREPFKKTCNTEKMDQDERVIQTAAAERMKAIEELEQNRKNAQWSGKYAEAAEFWKKKRELIEEGGSKDRDAQALIAADNTAYEACVAEMDVPVKFQFVLTADRKNFELGYVSNDAFGVQVETPRILAYIYQ